MPVEYVMVDGKMVVLNTRTSAALLDAKVGQGLEFDRHDRKRTSDALLSKPNQRKWLGADWHSHSTATEIEICFSKVSLTCIASTKAQ
jgi:hypothetical protein